MKLTSEQKQSVATWVAAGATLNEIQDRLKSEMGVVLTFMDTRFLLSDLGLSLILPAGEEDPKAESDAVVEDDGLGAAPEEDWPAEPGLALEDSPGGEVPAKVQVTVDVVTLPGTMVSGKVTFSDGVRGGWYLDQAGQLGLTGMERSYQPPEADVIAFQKELQRALR